MIGIDLGTTNCTVAFQGENGIEQFPLHQKISADMDGEKLTLPSFYFFPLEGDSCIGWYAKERGAELPDRVISSAKSWLCNHVIDRRSPFLPLGDFTQKMSPVEVCSSFLSHIRQLLSSEKQVFVTVPASFDPSARQLVQEATELAGFSDVILLEEPLAAFYAWLYKHEKNWRDVLKVGDTVLVADIGGGTTDFSLITVQDEGGSLHLERKAVGNHLLLGGDNIDLALAHFAKNKLGQELDEWQFQGLIHSARDAKEKLLGSNPPPSIDVRVPGRGSSLIGGAISITLNQDEVETLLVDGFFPKVEFLEEVHDEKRSGIAHLGLPYARDPRMTAQLAHFLRQAEADMPTAVLFNGGTMKATAFQTRLLHVLSNWRGSEVKSLPHADYDFGVSQGAVYYGMTRKGNGIRVRAGVSRNYYIGIEGSSPAIPGVPLPIKPVCIVPKGMEEGSEQLLQDETFSLFLEEPAVFRFFSRLSEKGELTELHPIETVLHVQEGDKEPHTVLVKLKAKVTELGVLELWCVASDGRKWKLEFDIRKEESVTL